MRMDQNEKSNMGTSMAGCPGGRTSVVLTGEGASYSNNKRHAVP